MEDKFKSWLQQHGAEILPPTNEYEDTRFKGKEVGVRYKSGKFSNKYAEEAYNCYKQGKKWDGRPFKTGRKKSYIKEKIAIQKRDGCNCFYCGEEMTEDDLTLEHLIPLTAGGLNELSNMVLAHEECNKLMGNKPLVEKVKYAISAQGNKTREVDDDTPPF